jgi:AbrB family looped-hinge helix DNA binding protein
MRLKLSATGRVTLPKSMRKKLGLRPGDEINIRIKGGEIYLTPKRRRAVND